MYIDEFGAEAKVLEWVDKNKDRFDYISNPEIRDRTKFIMETSKYKGYVTNSPVFDVNITMHRAYEDFLIGNRTEEEMFDIYNILYGEAVDIQLLEAL